MFTLMSEAGFCKITYLKSPNNLEYNTKDFLYQTPAPLSSYSCRTKLERHIEGVKEKNSIQSEKMIFSMFYKENKNSWRPR